MKKPTLQKKMVLPRFNTQFTSKEKIQPNLGYVSIDDLVTRCSTWDAQLKLVQIQRLQIS